MSYASGTQVAPSQTRSQIEALLSRFECDQVVVGYEESRAMLGFVRHGLAARISLPLPPWTNREFTHTPTGIERTERQAHEMHQKEVRRRWRSMLLILKAKVVAVEDGITTFEREFLPDLVLPSGETVLEAGGGPLREMIEAAESPRLLPGGA